MNNKRSIIRLLCNVIILSISSFQSIYGTKYPNLNYSYTTQQIDSLYHFYKFVELDSVGLTYTFGSGIGNENSTTKQLSEALYFFIEFPEILNRIPQKDACLIRIRLLSYYANASPKIVKQKLEEAEQILELTQKNNWRMLYIEAYLLKNYLLSHKNFGNPFPEDLLKTYEAHKVILKTNLSLYVKFSGLVGTYFLDNKEYNLAINCFSEVLELVQNKQNPFFVDFCKLYLAQAIRLNGDVNRAETYALQVWTNCRKSNNQNKIDFARWAAEELAHVYKIKRQYNKAIYYWEQYDLKIKEYNVQKSLTTEIGPTLIEKIELDLMNRKEKETIQSKLIHEMNRSNNFLGLLVILALISLLMVILWFYQRNQRLLKDNEIVISKSREQEREDIARELHDHVGNTLIAVKNAIPKTIKNYTKITEAINEVYSIIRQSSHALSTVGLASVGLVESCKDFIQLIDKEQIVKMNVVGNDNKLPISLSKEAFRITQELIQNILKYSQASEVNFMLHISSENLSLNFEDDGVGFDPVSLNNGIGLKNIEERIKRLGGDINTDSSPTYGSSFWINLPIQD